jgi:hypothetical protein
MKKIYKIAFGLLSVIVAALFFQGCSSPDDEFVHSTNTISQLVCTASHGSSEYRGDIYEYNKSKELVTGTFTQEDVEGGYGIITFVIPASLKDDIDITSVYLTATLTYDEFITPTLSGKHDISGDGIIITVKSGTGTTRQYRVRGYYE